jgi:hypothetical protein
MDGLQLALFAFLAGLTFAGLAGSAAGILILELAFCLTGLLG